MPQNYIEEAAEFIKTCNEKTALVYDTDADGVTAGAVVSKTMYKLARKYPVAIPDNHFMPYITEATRGIYGRLIDDDIESIITVDMPSDQDSDCVSKLAHSKRILVIDHHQPTRDMNSIDNVIHVNSHFLKTDEKPFNYCGSKLSYDICNEILITVESSWLAGAGIIGDYSGNAWKDFIDEIYRRYPSIKEGKDIYGNESELGEITSLINAGQSFSGSEGAKIAFEACLKSPSPQCILQEMTAPARKLREFRKSVDKEIDRLIGTWKKNAQIRDDKKTIFYEPSTTMFVQPEVANRISREKPDYTFVLTKRAREKTYATLRNIARKVNCGQLAKFATRNLENASGGGHDVAAGANFMTKDKERFKEEILKYQ